ncbi:prophage tail fiber N-terminal domain-containing protein, partial [Escherichia coli]
MLTHSLSQYLTLPATPPSPVALAAGVRFIHKARLYEREIKDSLYDDSKPGTLNDFLTALDEGDLKPDVVKRFEEMVAQTRQSA